ncbi:MAG: DUF4249 family protein [Methanomethylovorans sp.]|nr:DUF4249 family protein [Methanomethylovorans sp.]
MKYILVVLMLLLVSCTKVIEIDLPDAPDKLVVNCFFSTGSKFIVHLSHSQNILDEDTTIIKNGDIKLFINDIFQGSLSHIADGFYSHDTIVARAGVKYRITATAPGYNQVEAEDSAPPITLLDSVFYDPDTYTDSEGSQFYKIQIFFKDNISDQNFYEIHLQLFNDEDVFELIRLYGDNEKVILNEGDEEYYSGLCVFSDELINGNQYRLKLRTHSTITGNRKEMHLLSVSETFYKYRKSWIRHSFAQVPDLANPMEPVTLFSNVKGGYGIFAGYSANSIITD